MRDLADKGQVLIASAARPTEPIPNRWPEILLGFFFAARQRGQRLTGIATEFVPNPAPTAAAWAIAPSPLIAPLATEPDNTFVTSGGYGHCTDLSLAMGYVNRAIADAPAPMTVHIVGEERPACVLPDLLYDPSGLKLCGRGKHR